MTTSENSLRTHENWVTPCGTGPRGGSLGPIVEVIVCAAVPPVLFPCGLEQTHLFLSICWIQVAGRGPVASPPSHPPCSPQPQPQHWLQMPLSTSPVLAFPHFCCAGQSAPSMSPLCSRPAFSIPTPARSILLLIFQLRQPARTCPSSKGWGRWEETGRRD